ncbi:MAG: hypothetical protein IJ404_06730 [Clostridia bacterium]|nr:hypothetical protein [Clostridia bacterium]
MNKKQRDKESKRIERFDRALKDKLITAVMIAPALSIMILSVMYQSLSTTDIAYSRQPGVVLGWMTLTVVAATIVLAAMYNKTFVTLAFSILFGLASLSYGIVIINGTTNVLDDGFFDMLISVFILPVVSFISATGVGSGAPHFVPLIVSLLITGASIGATVYIVIKLKKAEEERVRKAEASKSGDRRRKVR